MLLTARKDCAHLTPHKPLQVNDSGKNKTKAVTYVKVSRVYSYCVMRWAWGQVKKKKNLTFREKALAVCLKTRCHVFHADTGLKG